MTINSEKIVQEIRAEFESMLQAVETEQRSTADSMERQLFKWMLELGRQLLNLYFIQRSAGSERTSSMTETGIEVAYHQDKRRLYHSIFGKIAIWRPYFYRQNVGSVVPLDAELSLGDDSYSDLVRELTELLGVEVAYEKVHDIFETLLGQGLSSYTTQGLLMADAQAVESYYEQKEPPGAMSEGTILVVQSDGKGVPLVRENEAITKVRLGKGEKRTKKKEAIVTALYTIAPSPRCPDEVTASFFHPEQRSTSNEQRQQVRPQNKQLHATLEGKDWALERLAHQVAQRDGSHIHHRVALADGCEALQVRLMKYFPDFTLVLDFIHANEYLWKAANSLFGEQDPQRNFWVESQTLQMLSGQTTTVIDDLRNLAAQPKRTKAKIEALQSAANYFERNLPYMHYDQYLKHGWPIASGVIEGACRHFVKDRCELSGMRWTKAGAEALLRLRSVSINDDWTDFHDYRKRQRHLRLYGKPLTRSVPTEEALKQPLVTHGNIIPLRPLNHVSHQKLAA